MIVVDASKWVSRLFAEDIFYLRSRRWLEEVTARGEHLTAPTILLPEVAGALARRTGDGRLGRKAVRILHRFPNLRLVLVRPALATEAANLAADLRLRGSDALYVSVAARLNLPLVTWDQEQLQRTRGMIAVGTPDEFRLFPGT